MLGLCGQVCDVWIKTRRGEVVRMKGVLITGENVTISPQDINEIASVELKLFTTEKAVWTDKVIDNA